MALLLFMGITFMGNMQIFAEIKVVFFTHLIDEFLESFHKIFCRISITMLLKNIPILSRHSNRSISIMDNITCNHIFFSPCKF